MAHLASSPGVITVHWPVADMARGCSCHLRCWRTRGSRHPVRKLHNQILTEFPLCFCSLIMSSSQLVVQKEGIYHCNVNEVVEKYFVIERSTPPMYLCGNNRIYFTSTCKCNKVNKMNSFVQYL